MVNCPEVSLKAGILYLVGVVFSLIFSSLLLQREVTSLPTEIVSSMVTASWWAPLATGFFSLFIGLLYPKVDSLSGKQPVMSCDWPSLIKCSIIFFGINHACMKLDYMTCVQLSVTLSVLSLVLWWIFDRTLHGLILGIISTFLLLFVSQFAVYNGLVRYKAPDLFLLRSWLPGLVFSGVITFGVFGRQISAIRLTKEHVD